MTECPKCGDAGSLFPSDDRLTLICDFCGDTISIERAQTSATSHIDWLGHAAGLKGADDD